MASVRRGGRSTPVRFLRSFRYIHETLSFFYVLCIVRQEKVEMVYENWLFVSKDVPSLETGLIKYAFVDVCCNVFSLAFWNTRPTLQMVESRHHSTCDLQYSSVYCDLN